MRISEEMQSTMFSTYSLITWLPCMACRQEWSPCRMAATIRLKEWISWTSRTVKLDSLPVHKLLREGSSWMESIGRRNKQNITYCTLYNVHCTVYLYNVH